VNVLSALAAPTASCKPPDPRCVPLTQPRDANPAPSTGGGGSGTTIAIVIALVVLAAAVLALWWWSRRARATGPAPADAPNGFVAACRALADSLRSDALAQRLRAALAQGDDGADGRQALIATLIELGDLVDDDETAAVRATLARAGVQVVDVTPGTAFDRSEHHAIDVTPTDDRALDGLVAGTVRPGYRDGRTLLREPEVAVYRCT
jgi:hypothetical protein